jgi:hypothetical protein
VYLVDMNVLSERAPTKAQTVADLVTWMDRTSDRLFLSFRTQPHLSSSLLSRGD